MFTATIGIGFSSSQLYILDEQRRGPALNLVWGDGWGNPVKVGDPGPDDDRPAVNAVARADALLAQNGYRRTGPWTSSRAGDTAPVEVVGPLSSCSCWYDERGARVAGDYWCLDHPEERQAWARAVITNPGQE